jgi:hypothetical protein
VSEHFVLLYVRTYFCFKARRKLKAQREALRIVMSLCLCMHLSRKSPSLTRTLQVDTITHTHTDRKVIKLKIHEQRLAQKQPLTVFPAAPLLCSSRNLLGLAAVIKKRPSDLIIKNNIMSEREGDHCGNCYEFLR